MAKRTLRAKGGTVQLSWEVTDTGPLVLLNLRTLEEGSNISKLLKDAAEATEWADDFVDMKERLGYRLGDPGRLDAKMALMSPCVELSADRTRATLQMSTWYDQSIYELEALCALCVACPQLADLTINDERNGSQRFDPYVALVLANPPPLTRLALRHNSYVVEDDVASAYTSLDNLEALLAGLPTLRELVLEVAVLNNVETLRHATLTSLRIKTGAFARRVAPALRTAELPALTTLHVDMLQAQGFTVGVGSSWQPILTGALPALRELAVVNAVAGNLVVDDLVTGTKPPALRRLDLSRSNLTARGAALLVAEKPRFDQLEALVLDGNPLDDADLAALRAAFGDRLAFTPAPPPSPDDDEA